MGSMKRQQGITMWGISVIILVGVFFLFLFFKLFPPYLEDMQVSSAIESFASTTEARNMAPPEALDAIQRRFDIENIRNVSTRRDLKIVPDGNSYAVEADYLVEIPMMGNISVLLDFEHRVPVR